MGIPAAIGLLASGLPNLGDQANAVLQETILAIGPRPAFSFRGPMNLWIWSQINTTLTTTAGSLAATVASGTGLAAGDAINSANLPGGSTIGAIAGTAVTLALAPRTHPGTIDTSGKVTGNFPTDRLLNSTVTLPSNNEGFTLPAGTTVTAILQANVAATPGNPGSPGVPGIIQLSNPPSVNPPYNVQVPFQFALTGSAVEVTGADTTALFTGANIVYSGSVQLERSMDGGKTWVVANIGNAGTLAIFNAGTPISIAYGEVEKEVLSRLNCTTFTSGPILYRISQTGGAAESLAIGPLNQG
jgi:hypothetical protein